MKTFAPWFSAIPLISSSFATRRRQRKKRFKRSGDTQTNRVCVCQERAHVARCAASGTLELTHRVLLQIPTKRAAVTISRGVSAYKHREGKSSSSHLFPWPSFSLSLVLSSRSLSLSFSLSFSIFIRFLPTLTWDGNFASCEHPFPFNFYCQTFLIFFFFFFYKEEYSANHNHNFFTSQFVEY